MKLISLLILLCTSWSISAQNCDNQLPPGNWNDTSISSLGNGSYKLSDLSAGFFRNMGIQYDMEATISIDCYGAVETDSFASDFGTCTILYGQWDSEQNKLTVSWKISANNFQETVVFQIN